MCENSDRRPGDTKVRHWIGDLRAADVCRRNGVSVKAFFARLRRGWSVERAATEPMRTARRITPGQTTRDLAALAGISRSAAATRLRYGWSVERIVAQPVKRRPNRLGRLPDGRTVAEAARAAGIKPGTLGYRLRRGWPLDRALNEPLLPGRKRSGS